MRPTEASIGADHVIDYTSEDVAQRRPRMSQATPATLEERPRR